MENRTLGLGEGGPSSPSPLLLCEWLTLERTCDMRSDTAWSVILRRGEWSLDVVVAAADGSADEGTAAADDAVIATPEVVAVAVNTEVSDAG